MELNVNDRLYGFTVTAIREFDGFDGRLVELTHVRTGAGLVWADNGDENKLFSVGFRTLPEDNTGVFHILEHSVLCGSDKFPVKEPFVELIKTSMNTFLNAMTYSDKTLYPVSSRMDQDYLNLTEVYLDAVFCPKILTEPNIFYQEGWHIDLSGEPEYRGVVFNEMKGAMSDIDQITERTMLKMLFPDTCYGYNSGGDPDAIPDLTYEDFISRYKNFYHPSNAYFYLDGDVPLEKTLSMIDSYLAGAGEGCSNGDGLGGGSQSGSDALGGGSQSGSDGSGTQTAGIKSSTRSSAFTHATLPRIAMQQPVISEKTCKYAVSVSETDAKAVIAFGRIVGTWEDRDKLLAIGVLTEQLADSNESPLKRAVLSSGLADDMEVYISDGIAQPYLMMIFRGADTAADTADRLASIVRETVLKVIENGIPEADLQASVNQLDFRLRQYPEPQALYRANAVFNSWLYGGDPALYLKTKESVDNLRGIISGNELYELASEYFADTDKFSKLVLLPSDTFGKEKEEAEAERVRSLLAGMNEAELAALEEQNERLHAWQAAPDSEEALNTIPQLDIADIKTEPELIGTEVTVTDGVTVLYHPVPTNGIVYINAYFPISGLSYDDLPAAALITEFYRDLPTQNYSVLQLQTEIRTYVGSLSFGIDITAKDNDSSVCTPCLRARAAVLAENISHAEDLIIEIMTRTRFDDKELMKELVTQIDDEGKRYALSSGHRLAIYAARSHYSSHDAAAEAVNGSTFLQYIHGMNSGFDERIDDFTAFAQDLISRSVVRKDAVISVTSTVPADISRLISMLDEGEREAEPACYTTSLPMKLGLIVPAAVSHSVRAFDLSLICRKPAGSLSVAANIITFAYLWNEIRVKGGAYGTSASASRTGSLFCYSYRDPDPAGSLEVYANASAFLGAFADADGTSLDGFIISTIASTEPLISPAAKGRAADDFWMSGFTDEDRIRVRREILSTTAEDLKSWCSVFESLASDGSVCVIGSETALETIDGLTLKDV